MTEDSLKSKCCNAEMVVMSGDEGTNHYQCLKCREACDAALGVKSFEVIYDSIRREVVDLKEYQELQKEVETWKANCKAATPREIMLEQRNRELKTEWENCCSREKPNIDQIHDLNAEILAKDLRIDELEAQNRELLKEVELLKAMNKEKAEDNGL